MGFMFQVKSFEEVSGRRKINFKLIGKRT